MSVRHASRRLLPLDEDMDAMYLSDKKNGLEREDDHEELEVLLESFSKQVEEIVNEAENIEVSTCITMALVRWLIMHHRVMYTQRRKLLNLF